MMWSAFKRAFGVGGLANKDVGHQESGPPSRQTEANVIVNDERAMMVSTVFACVRTIVQSGALLPLKFYRRTADAREELDDDHYLAQLLKYSPNQFMTGKEFRQAMWTQRVLWGNAYARIQRSNSGRPLALIPLKPEHVQVIRTGDGLVYRYSHDGVAGGLVEYQQSEMLHLKGFSTDGVIGLSPLAYARQSLGISVSADQHAAKSFRGRPNGVLTTDEILTKEQRAKVREIYGGIGDTAESGDGSRYWLLEGGFKWQDISIPPDDLQMLESRQFQVADIARFFGVPVVMIDGTAGAAAAWPASYEQQVLAFLTFTLKSYLEEWEDKITGSLVMPSERRTVYGEHSVEGFLRADSNARASFYSTMVQNGLMTRNEIRSKENLEPVDGADELTAQVNLTNLDDLPGATDASQD